MLAGHDPAEGVLVGWRPPGGPAVWAADATQTLAVLLFPGFSQLCLSSLIEPLRLANAVSARAHFRWRLASMDGRPVTCASGIAVGVGGSFRDEAGTAMSGAAADAVVLCAGEEVERHGTAELRTLLRLLTRRGVSVWALGTGTWLLADSGLLSDTRCTIHWGRMAALSETFYGLNVDDTLFVRDGLVSTCAGGHAACDLALDVIEQRCGADLMRLVCRHLVLDRRREGASHQSVPRGLRHAGTSEKLVRVIRLMEWNLEEPLPLSRISVLAGVSCRQIERLFRRHLSTTPGRYYLSLRLLRARELIESTNLSVLAAALACGFVSTSYFSRCFRDLFGRTPTSLRHTLGAGDT